MAYDEKLVELHQELYETQGTDEFEEVYNRYLKRLAEVAATDSGSIIQLESPYDYITDLICEHEYQEADECMRDFARMIEVLSDAGYRHVDDWKLDYKKCQRLIGESTSVEPRYCEITYQYEGKTVIERVYAADHLWEEVEGNYYEKIVEIVSRLTRAGANIKSVVTHEC